MIASLKNNLYQNKEKKLNISNKIVFKGWQPNNPVKTKHLDTFVSIIKDANNKKIAISGHTRPDGDSICATFALAHLINKATGKKIDLFIFGDLPKKFKFLNNNEDINVINTYDNKNYKAEHLEKKHGIYDLVITVDTALKRLIPSNFLEGIFNKASNTMKIDHHPYMKTLDRDNGNWIDNNFANYNYIDEHSDSASQIIMQMVNLFKINPKNLPKTVNEAFYAGLLSDTDNFKFARNAETFLDASLLLENGIDNIELQNKLKSEIPKCIFDIKQYLLNNLKHTEDGKIAYFIEDKELTYLKEKATKEGYKEEAIEEVSKFLTDILDLKNVEVSIKVTGTSFSVRSKHMDVSSLANKYGGGGHTNAAAFCVKKEKNQTIEEIVNNIIQEYKQQLDIIQVYDK